MQWPALGCCLNSLLLLPQPAAAAVAVVLPAGHCLLLSHLEDGSCLVEGEGQALHSKR
jgi:hypothetical protein